MIVTARQTNRQTNRRTDHATPSVTIGRIYVYIVLQRGLIIYVWNAHNTIFGSKHSAICALTVYFLHSTRLVSRDSVVDRHWLPAADYCQRYLILSAVLSTAFDVAENLGRFLVSCIGHGNDFELIPTVKMETRHPVEGSFGGEFPSIYNHCGVMAA